MDRCMNVDRREDYEHGTDEVKSYAIMVSRSGGQLGMAMWVPGRARSISYVIEMWGNDKSP
jgi:hypothetical protein